MSTFKYNRLDKNNAAVLLVDHQTGLFSLVRDIGAADFKNNVLALASAAKFFNLPTVLTTSFEDGPNGVIIPELKEKFPDAPFIPRPGQINAWDNEDFVKAVEATGKKQLIIAGIVTDVCVTFCALSALEAGYDVFVVTDASGTFDEACRYAAWDRMSRAGVQLVIWFSVVGELHRDWRNDIEGLGSLLAGFIPDYKNLMTSTVYRWLKRYQQGGIDALLEVKTPPGKSGLIPANVMNQLHERLGQPQGFKSYRQIQEWLTQECNIIVAYKTVHKIVRYKLNAKLKVPRPRSAKAKPEVQEAFKKNFQK